MNCHINSFEITIRKQLRDFMQAFGKEFYAHKEMYDLESNKQRKKIHLILFVTFVNIAIFTDISCN